MKKNNEFLRFSSWLLIAILVILGIASSAKCLSHINEDKLFFVFAGIAGLALTMLGAWKLAEILPCKKVTNADIQHHSSKASKSK